MICRKAFFVVTFVVCIGALIGAWTTDALAQESDPKVAKTDQETAMINQFTKQFEPAELSPESTAKTRVEIGKLLTEEQKAKLPKQLQNNLKEPTPKKK